MGQRGGKVSSAEDEREAVVALDAYSISRVATELWLGIAVLGEVGIGAASDTGPGMP